MVLADMQAGLEHLSWAGGTLRYVDLLLVVAHPTAKALLTAGRAHRLAMELGIPRVGFVGNLVTGDEDAERLRVFAVEHGAELWATVPADDAVVRADRSGACLLDAAPRSPSVTALRSLAERVIDESARWSTDREGLGQLPT